MNAEAIAITYILALVLIQLTLVTQSKRTKRTVLTSMHSEPQRLSYQGMLFTHPDDKQCDLTDTTKHMALSIDGYSDDTHLSLTLPAPTRGWTHGQIEAHIAHNNLDLWDARLGSIWIGGSEI